MIPDPSSSGEAPQPAWLPALRRIHEVIDAAVAEGIARLQAKGRRLACGRGCSACCRTHQDIPVYPLELMGIYRYVLEHLQEPLRARLKARLASATGLDACPFLVDDACAIHEARPMACRLFNVFDTVCAPGEDAFHSRPQDLLPPPEAAKREALTLVLAAAGVADAEQRQRLLESGAVHRLARSLRELPWDRLAQRMEDCTRPERRTPT